MRKSGHRRRWGCSPMADEPNKAKVDSRPPKAIWCVVANAKREHPLGESGELRNGTKHFAPGAKLYCFPALWGDGYERVKVIGRHRGSHRFVTMIVPAKWLERWRAELVYSPYLIRELSSHWDGSEEARAQAESLAHWQNTGELLPIERWKLRFSEHKPVLTRIRTRALYYLRRLLAAMARV